MRVLRALRRLRMSANLSQESLAAILGVDPKTIWAWEIGNSEPNLKFSLRLCEVLDTTMDILVKDEVTIKASVKQRQQMLGMEIGKIVGQDTVEGLFSQYSICSKRESILIPIKSINGFLNHFNNLSNDDLESSAIINCIKQFFLSWYKFNYANEMLSVYRPHHKLLIASENIFIKPFNDVRFKNQFYPPKAVMELRDQVIEQIINIENLHQYIDRIQDKETRDDITEIISAMKHASSEMIYPAEYYV